MGIAGSTTTWSSPSVASEVWSPVIPDGPHQCRSVAPTAVPKLSIVERLE